MTYTLRRQPNGSYSLYNPGLRETMHPHLGPWEEATRLYVGGSGLRSLLSEQPAKAPRRKKSQASLPAAERKDLVIFDVGLGGAANAVAALDCRDSLVRDGKRVLPLVLVSFERELEALEFAIGNAETLGYVAKYEDALQAILSKGQWEAPGVRWELRLGDFPQLIDSEPRRADAVFFDPFSHRTNPVMWSVPVLEKVYRCRRPGQGQRLVTYSSAYSVRAAMLLAGYYVGDGVRLDGRPTTIAVSDFSELDEPLDTRWLSRWRKDAEPWPPLTPPDKHKAIRQALLDHPQWAQLGESGDPDLQRTETVTHRGKGGQPPARGKRPWRHRR